MSDAIIEALRNRAKRFFSLDTPANPDLGEVATDVAAGFVPGVGTALSARDFERSRREGDKLGMALAGAGMIPVVGGAARAANKARKGSSATKATIEALRNPGPAYGAYGYTDDLIRRERGSFGSNFGVDYGEALTNTFDFVPVNKLVPTEKVDESRVRALMQAMKESGNTLENRIPPVIVDSRGNVLDGHHRLEATRRLGYDSVPVIEKFDRRTGPVFVE